MSAAHTPGPWIVIERRHPYKDGGKAHIERNIYTAWEHPQLKDNYPVVCTIVGIGMDGKKAIQFAHIQEADARLIAAAPELLEALENLIKQYHTVHGTGDLEMQSAIDFANRISDKATGAKQ